MTVAVLPLVERSIDVGALRVCVRAAVDQDALLRATQAQDEPPFGLMLWESAVVLARHIAARNLAGKRVLELGAGVGLTGVVAGLGGGRVTQTDHDLRALEVCASNAAANGVAAHVTQQHMDWRTWHPDARFDVILGADILYDRDDYAAIARVMREALAPDGHVYLADPLRPHTREFQARLAAEHWRVTVDQEHTPDLTHAQTSVAVQVLTCQATTIQGRTIQDHNGG